MVERGVPTMRVIPPFDEVEDRHARLGPGFETTPVEQFAFERGEKTLAQGVVETVAHRAHRRPHAGLVAALAEGRRGVLAAVVGVMNHPRRPALSERHVQCRQHQFGAQMSCLAQPTSLRLNASSTTARYRKPAQVGM